MPLSASDPLDSTEKLHAAARLIGWKEIAAYLGKTDRTVKRWGKHRGLPIHRVPGVTKTSVYAYPDEMDLWLKSASAAESDCAAEPNVDESVAPVVLPTPAIEPQPANPYARTIHTVWNSRWKWSVAMSVLLLAVVSLGIAIHFAVGAPATGALRSLFPGSVKASGSRGSMAVSDAEKREAQRFYARGRYEWNQRTPDSLNRALDSFTQAIVHDPGCAQAYVGLAETYDLLREYSTMPDEEAYSRGLAAARRAVELNDSLAEAHRALAFAEMYGLWDFNGAEKEFRRAIELDPNDPQARRWFANAFAVPSRYEEALNQLNKAQDLDPSSNATLSDKGLLLANAGHTKEAIDLLREVERSAPEFRSPHLYLMRISLATGDYPDFLSEGQSAAEVANDAVLKDIIAAARAGYMRDGGKGLLKDLYARQKQYYLAGKLAGTWLAKTCVVMGRKQEALQLLETAYARHENEVLSCLSHPDLLSLSDEPRYEALVAKIHFPMHPVDSNPRTSIGTEEPRLAMSTELH